MVLADSSMRCASSASNQNFVSLIILKIYKARWHYNDLLQLSKDVCLSEQVIFLLILQLHFGAAEFWKKNFVANLHAHRDVRSGLKY